MSLLVSLILAEAFLRLGVEATRLVPNAPETPELNQRRNELRFLERNRGREPEELSSHDPVLGWDAGPDATRVRGKREVARKTNRRAVTLGDSFVFGNEVEAQENFAALLGRPENDLEVLNMGVPGFGIDQSFLKYKHFASRYEPDVVIFGIYVSDYERSTVAFTAAAKPLFHLVDGAVALSHQPVPSPAAELRRIKQSLTGSSYLLEFARNRLPGARQRPSEFFDAGDRVISHILAELRDSLTSGQQLLIVHIPRGESFASPDPFHRKMSARLRAIYQHLSLETVDLGEVFLRKTPPEDVARTYYVVRESGSIGHFNPEGHRLTASEIASRLR